MATHWRKRNNHNQLPAKFQLLDYEPLIDKILSLCVGEAVAPRDIYKRFRQGLCTKAFGKSQTKIDLSLVLHKFSTVVPELHKEDLKQQCYLYLIELWEYFGRHWSKGGSIRSNTFYDYARTNLSRWMGIYVATVLVRVLSEKQIESDQFCEQSITDSFTVNLGWVFQESPEEMFKDLSLKDKYLIYLRYSKNHTDQEIAEMVSSETKIVKHQLIKVNKSILRRSKWH